MTAVAGEASVGHSEQCASMVRRHLCSLVAQCHPVLSLPSVC